MRIVAAVLAALLVTAAPAPARADWDHDAGSAYGNWFNPADKAPTGTAVVRGWSAQLPTGQQECQGSWGVPLVAGGRVVVETGHSIDAYGASSGKLMWRARLNHWGPGPTDREGARNLALASGRVLMVSSSCAHPESDAAFLTALDQRTGKRLWRRRLGVYATELVADKGVVVVSAGGLPAGSTTAYRITDGKQLWRRTATYTQPVSSLGRVLLTRADGQASYAKNSVTGKTLWIIAGRARPLAATPGLFVITRNGVLSGIRAATGKTQWTGVQQGSVALSGTDMFVERGDTIEVHNLATGKLVRSFPARYGQPVLAGGLVHQWQWIVDARTGAPFATVPGEGSFTHPVVDAGRIYTVEAGQVLRSYVYR